MTPALKTSLHHKNGFLDEADWEKEWEKIHSATRNQNCCRWISGQRWLPSRHRISNQPFVTGKISPVTGLTFVPDSGAIVAWLAHQQPFHENGTRARQP
jgi:hypothetical protein